MTDREFLPELVRRESRTFLQYVRESYPWAKGPGEIKLRDQIARMADEEGEHIAKLGRLVLKRRHPFAGPDPYPTSFTNSNFLDTYALVPKLLDAERQSLEALEREHAACADDELRAMLASYRDLKRRHVAELESLAAAK
jgi:hypothetical protein